MRRVIKVLDRVMVRDIPFPYGVHAIKVERLETWDEETKIGWGTDQYIPCNDPPFFVINEDDNVGAITTVKWIIAPKSEYMTWQDDGGR